MLARFLRTHFAAFCLISFTTWPNHGFGQEATDASSLFREQLAPILVSRCLACHGVKKEGGYSVATPAQLFAPGDSEANPVIGNELSKSELWRRLVAEDESERMPADAAPLTKAQLASFRTWIEAGAPIEPADQQRSMNAIAITRALTAPEHYPRAGAIHAIALSNAGDTIWIGGYAEITLWRVATGELLTRIPVAGPHIVAIALTPDESSLVVSSGSPGQRGVVERIIANDSIRTALDATIDIARDLTISRDGKRVAIGGHDGSLRVVELMSNHRFGQIFTMTPHADAVLAIAWSADGKHLATASRDRTAKLFEGEKLELIASYDRHERAVGGVAFFGNRPLSLDETGKLRLMAGGDSDSVVAEQSGLPRVLQRFVTNGEAIFIADRNRVRELRIETRIVDDGKNKDGEPKKKTVEKFREGNTREVDSKEWVTSLAVNESALAAGTQQGTITVWDRSSKQRLGEFLAKP